MGMPHHVQLHMGAVQQLLGACRTKGFYLSDATKRAIFWWAISHPFLWFVLTVVSRQDLNSSVITGSRRVVDHTTFPELHWRRDSFSPNSFVLPPGFKAHSHMLGEDFVQVLEDVYALQCIREYSQFSTDDVVTMAHVDNHQASIQSRLVGLPTVSLLSASCHVAAYLCSTMLRCKVWCASTFPVSQAYRLPHLKHTNHFLA